MAEDYIPKTEAKDDLLKDIHTYNTSLERKAYADRYFLQPARKAVTAPVRYGIRNATRIRDEDSSGAMEIVDAAKMISTAMGNHADHLRAAEEVKKIHHWNEQRDSSTIFRKIPFAKTESILLGSEDMDVIDPEKVTRGDLQMFEHKIQHPDATMEELWQIRKNTNQNRADQGKIPYRELGRSNRMKKRVDRLVELSEVNAFYHYATELVGKKTELFTVEEKRILMSENGLELSRSLSNANLHMELIRKVIRETPYFENWRELDPNRLMNHREIRKILDGRIKGIDVSSDELLKGGLLALDYNLQIKASMDAQIRKQMERGTVKEALTGRLLQEFRQDEDFRNTSRYCENAGKVVGTAQKTSFHAARTGGKAAYQAAAASGNLTVNALNAAGYKGASASLEVMGEQVSGWMDARYREWNHAVNTPKRIGNYVQNVAMDGIRSGVRHTGDGIRLVGRKIGDTRAGRVILQSRLSKGLQNASKGIFRTGMRTTYAVKEAAAVPFRLVGAAIDAGKKWILMPVMTAVGVLLLIEIILASLFGGASGGSGIVVTVLDEEIHFNHPGFTSPEEMGFQQRYDQSQAEFQSQIDSIIHGYAKTLNKKGSQIRYGVNGAENRDPRKNNDYVNGVTLHFDQEKSNNLEDILSCMTILMQQQQAEHHKEALELVDALYRSSHTYSYTESDLYACSSGCEVTRYFCNEAKNGYPSTEMRFAPYLYAELEVPDQDHECEVDRMDLDMSFDQYAGCTVTGTCYHNHGTDDDNFGRSRPSRSTCSNPEAVWDCDHDCNDEDCSHDCSRSRLGCAGYWICAGHNHYGCPAGHDAVTCFGHVNIVMNVYMKTMEELFELGNVGDGESV